MIKEKIRNSKGVNLVSLSIAVIVLLVLTNVIIYNIKDNLKIEKLKNMQSDIGSLRDKISTYYAQNGKIPASLKYTNINHIKQAGLISDTVDKGDFWVIDLAAIENLTLNYGEDFKKTLTQENVNQYKDLYIVNETSHNIFYVAGIKVDNEIFYTDYTAESVDSNFVDLRYVDNVKIPEGFYYVGGNKDTGIVISDVEGDDLENTKQGNQFVWVPVEDINEFKLIEGYSKNSSQGILSNCVEPLTTGYAKELAEYEAMKQSVEKHHGFYIGRFESGKVDNQVVVKKNAPVYNSIAWSNSDDMTNEVGGAVELAKKFASEEGYSSVTSTLCYGVQWDATLQFFDSKYLHGTCDSNSYVVNSEGKGWYNASSLINTGSNDDYAVKNIYDMAGNVYEWTMETYNMTTRTCRGGGYQENGLNHPSSYRSHNLTPSSQVSNVGFRITLYLNEEEKWSPTYDQEGTYKDKNGDIAYIPKGFQVSEMGGENTIDEGLVIRNAETNDRYVWIEVPKAIYTTAVYNEDYAGIEKDMQTYASAYREEGYIDTWYQGCGIATETEYTNLKNAMLKSVYDRGGFWIGQYEAGLNNPKTTGLASETVDSLISTNGKPLSQQNKYPYNYVTCGQAQQLATKLGEGKEYNTSLMFGIQWDLVLKFIESKGAKTQNEIKVDSTTWGNYNNATFNITRGKYTTTPTTVSSWIAATPNYKKPSSTTVLLTTGSTERNVALNIYDLAGDLSEWGLETNSLCVSRGGSLVVEGNRLSASSRYENRATVADYNIGFRLTLY